MTTARNKSLAFVRLMLAVFFLAALAARAHSPFDSSTRMFVHDTLLELALTVGRDGGATLLKDVPEGAFQNRPVGPAFPLPKEFATRLFEVASDGAALVPNKVEVRTDGLEFNLVLEYPRPAGSALAINAVYVTTLPASYKSAFVMTDELGNVLATRVLSQENHAFEVALPAATVAVETIPSAPATIFALPVVSIPQTNIAPAIATTLVTPPPNMILGFLDFLKLGIKHILTGYDHLLFLCGLLVVCRKVGPMLAIITCFTLAHSLTLALAALDLVQISPRLTEPLIAATIVFVGIENFRGAVKRERGEDGGWKMADGDKPQLHLPSSILHLRDPASHRYALALGFGLIHGFGFATALRETGLGGTGLRHAVVLDGSGAHMASTTQAGLALVKPLLAFNLGVECGQLAVAAVFLPLLFALRKIPWFARHGTQVISSVVVLLGGYWLVERTVFTIGR